MFQIESHAVERYIERHVDRGEDGHPKLDYQEAYDLLWDHANNRGPIKLKKRTHRGDAMWKLSELDVILVVKNENGVNVAVTCIPNMEQSQVSPEERERIEEYLERIKGREAKAREEAEAKKKEITDRLCAEALEKRKRNELGEELANSQAVFRRKMALMAEERGMVKDQIALIQQSQAHEIRKLKVESDQANEIRQLKKALKQAVGFLMDHKGSHPEAASVVMRAIRLVNPTYLDEKFYNSND